MIYRETETVGGLKTYYTLDDYLGKGLPKTTEIDIFAYFKKSKNMWELFQQILQEKMTPNQFLVLYGMKKSLSIPLDNIQDEVTNIDVEDNKIEKKENKKNE